MKHRHCVFSFFFYFTVTLFLGSSLFLTLSDAAAGGGKQKFPVNLVLSDGKGGRVWRQWRQQIPEKNVQSVSVVLSRVSGGNDTFVNLRYGSGQTFENGKQIFLQDNSTKTVSWNVGGVPPRGQPLVLNAYKGEVKVISVTVDYVSSGQPYRPRQPKPPRVEEPDVDEYEEDDDELSAEERAMERRCQRLRRVRAPRIEIGKLKPTGGLFSGKYRAEGSMYGACVEEAGYFENGRLKEEVRFPITDSYKRKEFSFKVRTGRNGELRIYTVTGAEDTVSIDEEIANQQSVFR